MTAQQILTIQLKRKTNCAYITPVNTQNTTKQANKMQVPQMTIGMDVF